MANGQIKCYRVAKNMRLSGQIEMRFTGQIHAITHYIGLARKSQPYNFISMTPKKGHLNLRIKLPKSEFVDSKIESSGLETLEYNDAYVLRLTKDEINREESLISELMKMAYDERAKQV